MASPSSGRTSPVAPATTTAGAVASTGITEVGTPIYDAGIAFILNVSAAATDAADTLDVQVQTLLDGTNWLPIVHFTQVLGNGGAIRHVAIVVPALGQAMFNYATALGAGSVRHVLGPQLRAEYVIVDADADSAFTFSVSAVPQ